MDETLAKESLSGLSNDVRLRIYNSITKGCQHLWSKNVLQNGQTIIQSIKQEDGTYTKEPVVQDQRLQPLLDDFAELAEKDPIFLAHFTSYANTKLQSKDLQVVSTFMNFLSDADGTPFSKGSKFKKPNLRVVSQAAIQMLDPKLVSRVVKLSKMKIVIGSRQKATHSSTSLKTAVKKYLRFREQNPKAMEGVVKNALTNYIKNLFRDMRIAPSVETAEILGWEQREGEKIEKKNLVDFSGLSDKQIAEKIIEEKISPLSALPNLSDKISPVIALAILETCTGDQAVIYRQLFDSQGLLKNKKVLERFEDKVSNAQTALDRVDKINTEIDNDVEKVLKTARSKKRKEDVGDIGKTFIHIDVSDSMEEALEFAKERGSIIAECIDNPEENFHWGTFCHYGTILPQPTTFEKDEFRSLLYEHRADGSTDAMVLYERARELGCEIDIYLTDQCHNGKNVAETVSTCIQKGLGKPKLAVIIDFPNTWHRREVVAQGKTGHLFAEHLKASGIPVSIIDYQTLTESALVAQAIKTAMIGETAIIEDIMKTPLLKLPSWWASVPSK